MRVICKKCLPKEGIEVPNFLNSERKILWGLKSQSSINAVTFLMETYNLKPIVAKYIVTHINVVPGKCNSCANNCLDEEYQECPKCGSLNFNWV